MCFIRILIFPAILFWQWKTVWSQLPEQEGGGGQKNRLTRNIAFAKLPQISPLIAVFNEKKKFKCNTFGSNLLLLPDIPQTWQDVSLGQSRAYFLITYPVSPLHLYDNWWASQKPHCHLPSNNHAVRQSCNCDLKGQSDERLRVTRRARLTFHSPLSAPLESNCRAGLRRAETHPELRRRTRPPPPRSGAGPAPRPGPAGAHLGEGETPRAGASLSHRSCWAAQHAWQLNTSNVATCPAMESSSSGFYSRWLATGAEEHVPRDLWEL